MIRLKAIVFISSILVLGVSLQPTSASACDGQKKADVSTSSGAVNSGKPQAPASSSEQKR